MWNEALSGIQQHLFTTTRTSHLDIVTELPHVIGGPLSPKMDHLVRLLLGAVALSAKGGRTVAWARARPGLMPEKERQMRLARDLMKTYWGMYAMTRTGLAPEIAWFDVAEEDLGPRSLGNGRESGGE
jgi:mannosyl-oligosaccharide alpha-1,2-mannosidase